jgi:inner membrane protein
MHREGHVGAAFVAFSPIGAILLAVGLEGLALGGGAVAFALATLPDVDHRLPFVSHRGVTHTVHFAVAVGGIVGLAGVLLGSTAGLGTALALGAFGGAVGSVTILSHIAADALTPMGVEPFRNGRRYSFDLVRAANPIANYLLLGIGVVAIALAYVVGTGVSGPIAALG